MNFKISLSIFTTAALMLTACVSGYKKFYKPYNGATPQRIAEIRANPPSGTPIVDHYGGTDYNAMANDYESAGYIPIGFSSFNGGGGQSDSGAIAEAKRVGADLVVIMSPKYTGTRSSVIPWSTPTSSTSYTDSTATAYGSDGESATAYGNSTTTTYGSKTTYIPIHTDRFDYGAIYFVKLKYKLGLMFGNLTDAMRERLGTNRALPIRIVVHNSPAYNADIFPGDIITSIDGHPATSEELNRIVKENSNGSITITIDRHGKKIEKKISL